VVANSLRQKSPVVQQPYYFFIDLIDLFSKSIDRLNTVQMTTSPECARRHSAHTIAVIVSYLNRYGIANIDIR
jgi:hypothetical protein